MKNLLNINQKQLFVLIIEKNFLLLKLLLDKISILLHKVVEYIVCRFKFR